MNTIWPILKKVLFYPVENYLFLALCTSGLTLFSYYTIGAAVNGPYIGFVFISTYLLYNHHEVLDKSKSDFKNYILKHPQVVFLSIACIILLLLGVSVNDFWVVLLAGIVVAGYYGVWFSEKWTFRRSWMKPISIGVVFGLLTATFPNISSGQPIEHILLLTGARVFFISALALLFDVGDLVEDAYSTNITIPTLHGMKTSVSITIFMTLTAIVLTIIAYNYHWINHRSFLSLLLTYLLSGYLIFWSSPQRHHNFYLFFVDGMIGLPLLLWWLSGS